MDLATKFPTLELAGVDFMKQMFIYDPAKRITVHSSSLRPCRPCNTCICTSTAGHLSEACLQSATAFKESNATVFKQSKYDMECTSLATGHGSRCNGDHTFMVVEY